MDRSAILRGEQMLCEIEVYKIGDMFEQQTAEPVSWSKNCDLECAATHGRSTYEQGLTY